MLKPLNWNMIPFFFGRTILSGMIWNMSGSSTGSTSLAPGVPFFPSSLISFLVAGFFRCHVNFWSFLPLFSTKISLENYLYVWQTPKLIKLRSSLQKIVEPIPLDFSTISISIPSFITKCRMSENLVASSQQQITSISFCSSGCRTPFFSIGLKTEFLFFVKAWKSATILELFLIVIFLE